MQVRGICSAHSIMHVVFAMTHNSLLVLARCLVCCQRGERPNLLPVGCSCVCTQAVCKQVCVFASVCESVHVRVCVGTWQRASSSDRLSSDICKHACMRAGGRVGVWAYACHACMCACMRQCLHACVAECVRMLCCACVHACARSCMRVHACMRTSAHASEHVREYVHLCARCLHLELILLNLKRRLLLVHMCARVYLCTYMCLFRRVR